jgi:diguanylate cyclase (GGDEF)-like protein
MSAVQRTMHREYRGGSGCRPEAPWAFDRLPRRRRLRAYLIAVTGTEFILAAWQLTRLQPVPDQLGLFAVVLGCGMVCIEATRRGGAPPPGAHDLLTAWWLPAALLLPPEYAMLGPVLIGAYAHWRARQGPLYWRAFTAAALGLAGAASSVLFHSLYSLVHPHGPWLRDPVMVLGAACCAGLFVLVNALLIALAGRAARSALSWPGVSWSGVSWSRTARDFESLLVDAAGLCAGVLVTIACTLSWAMLVVALPPVILLRRSLLHQQLRAAAQSDPKTGLLNAVAWQREAEQRIRRARRAGGGAAVLLVDIDHFKRVNDTYGHLAGDELLAATASTLGQHVRACDVLGRFGGEEFVAVLPGAGQQEACRIAERLRGRVRDMAVAARGATAPGDTVSSGTGSSDTSSSGTASSGTVSSRTASSDTVTVTVSIGVAALGRDGEDLFELLAAADAALYRAKKSGRDRVCTLPPGGGPSDPLR